jgi:hypothetical protein
MRITSSLYYERFTPPSFRFSFLNHTLLGYPRNKSSFQHSIHNIKTIKHFRRDSYAILPYLVPHRHGNLFIPVLGVSTPSDIVPSVVLHGDF